MNARQIIQVLEKAGWRKDVGGRHLIMLKDGIRVPIPVHGSKDIKIGTLKSIEKATGVNLR